MGFVSRAASSRSEHALAQETYWHTALVSDALEVGDEMWPRAGDDPFAPAGRSRLIACLNFTGDEPWLGYVEGFKRLADLGVTHLEEEGHGHDYLVYPIVFAYRHHIELALKVIIRDTSALLDEDRERPKMHKLLALWEMTESLLRRIAEDDDTYAAVRDCLRRFDELDPSSESFRYPITAAGDAVLPGVYNLDLGQVRAVVARLSTFLDCVMTDLAVNLDTKREIEQTYRDVLP